MQESSSTTACITPLHAFGASSNADSADHLDVLLIEDSAADAHLLQAYLADCDDVRASWAPTLGAALEQLSSRPFDAILLDLSLPDARGGDLIARVQAAAPDTPIIVLSGQAVDDRLLTQAVIRKGAEDFLPKSEMTAALVARTITMAVERNRSRRIDSPRQSLGGDLCGQPRIARFVWSAADRQVRLLGDVGNLLGVDPAIAGTADKVLIRRLTAHMRHSLSVARRELRAGANRLSVILVEPPNASRERDLAIDIVAERDGEGGVVRLEGLCRETAMPSELERLADGTTAALGHKLRTPLTAIRGALGLLSGGAQATLPSEAKQLVDQAIANANRLSRLIAALLDPDGASVAATPLRPARAPFGAALDAAVDARRNAIQSAGIDVHVTRACRAIDQTVDIDRLRRAVDCLLGQANNEADPDRAFAIEAMPGVGIVWLKLCRVAEVSAPSLVPVPSEASRENISARTTAYGADTLRVAVVLAD